MRFHTQTAGCSLTMQQPYVNIIRSTIEALAAVLGGTQSLHVNSFDEAWALPTEEAALLSLRTQQVIAEETGVANTVDPLGGAYYVEWMTNKMEEGARDYFRRIEQQGGVIPAIKSGFFQQEIADAAYQFQRRVEERDFIWVGVNEYVMEQEPIPFRILKIPEETRQHQVQRMQSLRRERDNRAVSQALRDLQAAARRDENLMPPILTAVKAYATLGEIVNTLKEVYGTYTEALVI
jgi:methylmalonyl-CoA mutase N-terminal domain/subunit